MLCTYLAVPEPTSYQDRKGRFSALRVWPVLPGHWHLFIYARGSWSPTINRRTTPSRLSNETSVVSILTLQQLPRFNLSCRWTSYKDGGKAWDLLPRPDRFPDSHTAPLFELCTIFAA